MNLVAHFIWNRLESLSPIALHGIHVARQQVFIVEQHCAYQDADALDPVSWHLQCTVNGQLAGYLRVVDAGYKFAEPSIGRVITLPQFRSLGIGVQLMQAAINGLSAHYPNADNRISAQAHLQKFYAKFGYQVVSEEYLEDGIPHIEMLRKGSAVDPH